MELTSRDPVGLSISRIRVRRGTRSAATKLPFPMTGQPSCSRILLAVKAAPAREDPAATAVVEDYLQVLHYLRRDGVPAIGARLAERLNVTSATVTATLHRMERDGL